MTPSKGLSPGGCVCPVDSDIDLQARVSLRGPAVIRPCQCMPFLTGAGRDQLAEQIGAGSPAPYASGGDFSHSSWMMLHWTLLCRTRAAVKRSQGQCSALSAASAYAVRSEGSDNEACQMQAAELHL